MRESDAHAIGRLSAAETAKAIRTKAFSLQECVEAAYVRAKASAGLNCIASLIDRDAAIASAAPVSGVWAGVPTLIKDTDHWIGASTRAGSAISPTVPAHSQTPFMDSVRAGGVAVIGKSATPEFAMHLTTEPVAFGPCRNPWNTEYSVGGSSGGAAAAVAAGIVPIAHAGDAAGSIRIPASACGVIGFKPSRGRTVSNGDDGGPARITSQGAVARTMDDVREWVLLTQDGSDVAMHTPQHPTSGRLAGRRFRIGVRTTGLFPDVEVHACILKALHAMADALARMGHRIEQAPAPADGEAFADAFTTYWGFAAVSLVQTITQQLQRTPLVGELEARTLAIAEAFLPHLDRLPGALDMLGGAWGKEAMLYERCDLILSPVTTATTPLLGGLAWDGGDARQHVMLLLQHAAFAPLQNATGQPCLVIPAGLDASGLPIGLQIAAAPVEEEALLALGLEMEREGVLRVQAPSAYLGRLAR